MLQNNLVNVDFTKSTSGGKLSSSLAPEGGLTVVCETKWDETKWNETKWDETKWKSVVCEMKICSLRNENL